jgi:hypothetical protein
MKKYRIKDPFDNIVGFDEKLGVIYEMDLLPFGELPNCIEEVEEDE